MYSISAAYFLVDGVSRRRVITAGILGVPQSMLWEPMMYLNSSNKPLSTKTYFDVLHLLYKRHC